MNNRAIIVLMLCAFAASAHAQSQPTVEELPAPRAGFAFPDKQTLTYVVDWRVFSAGTAVIHFEGDGNTEHISANADTLGAVNLIFRIDDHFESSFDRQRGCTSEFDKQTSEGKRQIHSTLRLDYGQSRAYMDQKNLVKGEVKHEESPISGCLTDLLTGVFYAASQPIELGHNFELPLFDAQHVIAVTMKPEAREQIKTTLGTFQTIRVHPTADAGVVKNRGDIWIWYTTDDRHLPVQMQARLFWGTITFRLTAIESK